MSGIIGGIKGTMKKKFVASAVGDANWANVSLLLNGDDLLDHSSVPKTITNTGSVSVNTTTKKYGTGSLYFSGTSTSAMSTMLTVPTASALDIKTGDFTIEMWFYATSLQNYSRLFNINSTWTTDSVCINWNSSSSNLVFSIANYSNPLLSTTAAPSMNTWNHLAVTRSGSTFYLFLNGVLQQSASWSGSMYNTTTPYYTIGNGDVSVGGYSPFTGYIDDLRITKDVARYTANFTPSASAFPTTGGTAGNFYSDPYWPNVSLMLTGDDLLDRSINPKSLTNTGSVTVDTSIKKYGTGSLGFSSTKYLSISDSTEFDLSGGKYTIEGWIYPTGDYSNYNTIIAKRNFPSAASWEVFLNITNGVLSYYNGSIYSSSVTPTANTWSHFAAVYDGANMNLYLNGTSVLSTAIGNTNSSAPIVIGTTGGEQFKGYLDDLRITKGAARYTANFTPPTYALPTSAAISSITPVGSYHPNWGDAYVTTSNNIGLSSTATLSNGRYTVTDTYGVTWNILANFGYSAAKVAPTRWNGAMWRDVSNRDHVYDMSTKQLANSSLSTTITPGVLYRDAVTFSNSSGAGFSNWYSDSKTNQAFPTLNTSITTALTSSGTRYDTTGAADSNGGAVWFEPPVGTTEVMIDFANSHSNGSCSLAVVDKTTGNIVKTVIGYGNFGTVNTATGALNDANSRTVIFRHQTNYVYFNTDHAGTIAGSHYILYR